MVVMIDCHTDTLAHEIEPHQWLAIIHLRDSRERRELYHGWRFLLELETNRDGANSSVVGMSPDQIQEIVKFWLRLAHERSPLALVVRGDDRSWAAGVGKALGEVGGLYVPMPEIEYNSSAYQSLATELRSALRAERRNSVASRIRTMLGQSR